jgi:hypothetical protein
MNSVDFAAHFLALIRYWPQLCRAEQGEAYVVPKDNIPQTPELLERQNASVEPAALFAGDIRNGAITAEMMVEANLDHEDRAAIGALDNITNAAAFELYKVWSKRTKTRDYTRQAFGIAWGVLGVTKIVCKNQERKSVQKWKLSTLNTIDCLSKCVE